MKKNQKEKKVEKNLQKKKQKQKTHPKKIRKKESSNTQTVRVSGLAKAAQKKWKGGKGRGMEPGKKSGKKKGEGEKKTAPEQTVWRGKQSR